MRKFFALLAAFVMTASQALAFDHLTEPVGLVYFSIPFGAPTKQEATPWLGFRFDYGFRPGFDDSNARAPYSLADWRLNLDGQTSLRFNGVDVGQLPQLLYAAEDKGIFAWWEADQLAVNVMVVGMAYLVYVVIQFPH